MRFDTSTLKNDKFKTLLGIVKEEVSSPAAGVASDSVVKRKLAEAVPLITRGVAPFTTEELTRLDDVLTELLFTLETSLKKQTYAEIVDAQFDDILKLTAQAMQKALVVDLPSKAPIAAAVGGGAGTLGNEGSTKAAPASAPARPAPGILTSMTGDPIASSLGAPLSTNPSRPEPTSTPAAGGAGAPSASPTDSLRRYFPQQKSLMVDGHSVDLGIAFDYFPSPLEPKKVFAIPRLMLTAPRALPRQIIFLADTSGSMNYGEGLGINALKDILRRVYAELLPTDQVSLITFSDRVTTSLRLASKSAIGGAFEARVGGLRAHGDTLLNQALISVGSIGGVVLGSATIIVLTDGKDSGAPRTPQEVIGEVQRSFGGALPRILTVGLGHDYDQAWAKAMGQATNYGFIDARDMGGLREHVGAIMGGLAQGINAQVNYGVAGVESADLGIISVGTVTQAQAILMAEPAFTMAGRLRTQTRAGEFAVEPAAHMLVTNLEEQKALLTTYLIAAAKAIYDQASKTPQQKIEEIEALQASYGEHGLVSEEARGAILTRLVILDEKRLFQQTKDLAYANATTLHADVMARIFDARRRNQLVARYAKADFLYKLIERYRAGVTPGAVPAGAAYTGATVGNDLLRSMSGFASGGATFVPAGGAAGAVLARSAAPLPPPSAPVAGVGALLAVIPGDGEDPHAVVANQINMLGSATARQISLLTSASDPLAVMRSITCSTVGGASATDSAVGMSPLAAGGRAAGGIFALPPAAAPELVLAV